MSNKLGPWIAKPGSGDGGWLVVENFVAMWLDAEDLDLDHRKLTELAGTHWQWFPAMNGVAGKSDPLTKEMAWLIAAAPDLLDACRSALAALPPPSPKPFSDPLRNALNYAINRAETGCA